MECDEYSQKSLMGLSYILKTGSTPYSRVLPQRLDHSRDGGPNLLRGFACDFGDFAKGISEPESHVKEFLIDHA
jgi:hypothetical protein